MVTTMSYMTNMATPCATQHVISEKAKAVCFLRDVRPTNLDADAMEDVELLPLVAAGGWDNENCNISLHLPLVATSSEQELRQEFAPKAVHAPCELRKVGQIAHDGDVNALRFAAIGDKNLLFSASSLGNVHAFQVGDESTLIAPVEMPSWRGMLRGGATCLDVSPQLSTLVAAGECGQIVWLRLDGEMSRSSVEGINNPDVSRLPIFGIKMLGHGSVVATVGGAPGSQLRLWDITANRNFPVLTTTDSDATTALVSIEVHPTRPELLVTGSETGTVCFWDQRRLDAPIRVETEHRGSVSTLLFHPTAPRFLFTGGEDATVKRWDFHYGRQVGEAVEYEQHGQLGASNLQVQPVFSGSLPWNAMDFHAPSDTLVAGSDAQTLLLVRRASHSEPLAMQG